MYTQTGFMFNSRSIWHAYLNLKYICFPFRRGFGRKKEEGKTERLMGQLMVVCHDCKAMVQLHFILCLA